MIFSVKNLINYLAVIAIFADPFHLINYIGWFEFRGSYFILPIILILCFMTLKKIYFNRTFLIICCLLAALAFYSVLVGGSTFTSMSKAIIGIFLTSLTYYLVFKVNNYDVKKIFTIYLNITFFACLYGLLQEVGGILNINILPGRIIPLDDFPLYRISSFFPEPAHFCDAIMPAVFVSLVSVIQGNILLNKWKSWVIIAAFTLTFSALGFISILLCFILVVINYGKTRYVLAGALLVSISFFLIYSSTSQIKTRVDDTLNVISGASDIYAVNLSTYALLSNYLVAYRSFLANPIFGGGLGSHEMSYLRHIDKLIDIDKETAEMHGRIVLNFNDAGSLFNRLLSETGLFGLFAFIFFIYKGHILRMNDKTNYLWIINNAILVLFFSRLLRSGHYFIYGFFFFFWAYYFSKIQSREISRSLSLCE